jgi:hypothetical protein
MEEKQPRKKRRETENVVVVAWAAACLLLHQFFIKTHRSKRRTVLYLPSKSNSKSLQPKFGIKVLENRQQKIREARDWFFSFLSREEGRQGKTPGQTLCGPFLPPGRRSYGSVCLSAGYYQSPGGFLTTYVAFPDTEGWCHVTFPPSIACFQSPVETGGNAPPVTLGLF